MAVFRSRTGASVLICSLALQLAALLWCTSRAPVATDIARVNINTLHDAATRDNLLCAARVDTKRAHNRPRAEPIARASPAWARSYASQNHRPLGHKPSQYPCVPPCGTTSGQVAVHFGPLRKTRALAGLNCSAAILGGPLRPASGPDPASLHFRLLRTTSGATSVERVTRSDGFKAL